MRGKRLPESFTSVDFIVFQFIIMILIILFFTLPVSIGHTQRRNSLYVFFFLKRVWRTRRRIRISHGQGREKRDKDRWCVCVYLVSPLISNFSEKNLFFHLFWQGAFFMHVIVYIYRYIYVIYIYIYYSIVTAKSGPNMYKSIFSKQLTILKKKRKM